MLEQERSFGHAVIEATQQAGRLNHPGRACNRVKGWSIHVTSNKGRESNGSRVSRKVRTLAENSEEKRTVNELTLGVAILAFALGALTGWALRKPKTLTTVSPDFEREKTLFEAQQQALMEDIQLHLQDTASALELLAQKQQALTSQLRGESAPLKELTPASSSESLEVEPPRDYADIRGQLNS